MPLQKSGQGAVTQITPPVSQNQTLEIVVPPGVNVQVTRRKTNTSNTFYVTVNRDTEITLKQGAV